VIVPVPLRRPENFMLDNITLTSNSAEFTWDPVDPSVEYIRGFFIGYQVINYLYSRFFVGIDDGKFNYSIFFLS